MAEDDILSEEEINKLLATISDDDDNDDNDNEVDYSTMYDFRQPNRFPRENLRVLRNIHDKFISKFAYTLSDFIGTMVEISNGWVEQMTYSDFIKSLPDPTSFHICQMNPLGSIAIGLNPSITFPLIDILAGGAGLPLFQTRRLTAIETGIIDKILDLLLADLTEAWRASFQNIDFQKTRSENSAFVIPVVPQNEMVALIALMLKFEEVSGMINICIPHSVTSSLIATEYEPFSKEDVINVMQSVLVPTFVELGSKLFTIAQLQGLKEGDTISFDSKPYLFANNKPIFDCTIEGEKIILKNKLTQNEVYMEIDSSIETKNINILDINVHLSVRMGSREMSLKDIYQFESGTIVMMRQHTDDLVELVANNKVIAKGEIVVDGDEMGIRIKELVK